MASMSSLANKGRKGDTIIAHLTEDEIVIPKGLAQNKDFQKILSAMLAGSNISIEQITVGNKANSINPNTGHPEFGFFSDFFSFFNPISLVKKVLDIFTPDVPKQQKDEAFEAEKAEAKEAALTEQAILEKKRKDEVLARKAGLRGQRSLLSGGFLGFEEDKTVLGA